MLETDAVARRLDVADLEALGLRPEDQAELRAHLTRLDADDLARVAAAAERLAARVGDLEFPWPRVLADLRDEPGRPMGLLPLLALGVHPAALRVEAGGRDSAIRTTPTTSLARPASGPAAS